MYANIILKIDKGTFVGCDYFPRKKQNIPLILLLKTNKVTIFIGKINFIKNMTIFIGGIDFIKKYNHFYRHD